MVKAMIRFIKDLISGEFRNFKIDKNSKCLIPAQIVTKHTSKSESLIKYATDCVLRGSLYKREGGK
jgi:hypothetical protein